MHITRSFLLLCLTLLCIGTSSVAPAALVEDISGPVSGAAIMQYVAPGRVLHLSGSGRISLGYLHSCIQEVITGGTVTVGANQSVVKHGKVLRERVECDGGHMRLAAQQATQAGAFVTRGGSMNHYAFQVVRLYSLSPFISLIGGGIVRMERLDQSSPTMQIRIRSSTPYYDFAQHRRTLAAGGLYRVSSDSRVVMFRVDPKAQATNVPIISRLLNL